MKKLEQKDVRDWRYMLTGLLISLLGSFIVSMFAIAWWETIKAARINLPLFTTGSALCFIVVVIAICYKIYRLKKLEDKIEEE